MKHIVLCPITNTTNGTMLEQHTLAVPPCCPVSKNPRLGSTITILYKPRGCSLEVGNLIAYIHAFRGGLYDEQGQLVVRDMEGMIQRIAIDAAQALGVAVRVHARLQVVPRQEVNLKARGYPG